MESTASASDGPPSCAGGCGFFGSPALSSYCSICFKKAHGEEEFKRRTNTNKQLEDPPTADEVAAASAAQVEEPVADAAAGPGAPHSPEVGPMDSGALSASSEEEGDDEPGKKKPKTARCFECRKKVGLTGFQCRCGGTFCGTHRYSDKHNCSFDYKAAGRDQIAKANPTITPEKVDKI
mmetsp:Transcript_34697/g.71608  ORF Transcript_34697/g.71608 Transcript_34697/m.71608 type:complete len:179 (+) Transcript_34697:84-620(+)|eukprot:CAMPEP_0181310128 /NCGR_PEP_ID=MMETSP1101-20121128/12414_1 /TAXON_ID=46948 /ORGANISM="Rhodomonas abbreviata, Strain Caron Lab Isolate" /LENGTH=178 /DNA_ID=CAMNT_0023416723 /DNA_START=73 /DNA_END=609 /DNA_ORIENTATION=-